MTECKTSANNQIGVRTIAKRRCNSRDQTCLFPRQNTKRKNDERLREILLKEIKVI